MPFPLSDTDVVQFVNDDPTDFYSVTYPGSKVVSWNGRSILIYAGADGITYLSDVSDVPQLAAISTAGYGTTAPLTMVDTLPQAILDTITGEAATAGALVSAAGNSISGTAAAIAKAAGTAAASAISPLASSLSPLLIAGLVVLLLMYGPKRS